MDQKQKIALGLIGGLSAFGLGYMLTRLIKGQGGIFDNNPDIPGDGNGGVNSTPPGYVLDPTTNIYTKVLPESDYKITQLITGYPVMQLLLDIPLGGAFHAQFALGKWYSTVPSIFTEQVFAPCPQSECVGGRIWKDRYEREAGPDAYTGICPICGGTGQIDVTPKYPLDIAAEIWRADPSLHLPPITKIPGGDGANYNFKVGDGVFIPAPGAWPWAVRDILGAPWIPVGGVTNSYATYESVWIREPAYTGNPYTNPSANPHDYDESNFHSSYSGAGPNIKPNPIPTSYSITDTLATNIDCGEGYYYDGKKCVMGTHPPNPYKNQKYDVMAVLYEAGAISLIPRDYIIAINAVTTGDAISEHDGSEIRPYVYNEGWQGSGYYMNIPGTSGAAVYVGTLEDYNNLV